MVTFLFVAVLAILIFLSFTGPERSLRARSLVIELRPRRPATPSGSTKPSSKA